MDRKSRAVFARMVFVACVAIALAGPARCALALTSHTEGLSCRVRPCASGALCEQAEVIDFAVIDPTSPPVSPTPDAGAANTAGPSTGPDAVEILLLRKNIGSRWIRVKCGTETFELPDPRFDADGVSSNRASAYQPRRVAIIQGKGVEPPVPPRMIPWQSIETIEVGHSRWRSGLVVGAVIGLGLMVIEFPLVVAILSTPQNTSSLLALAGVTLGATVLTTTAIAAPSKRWSVVYVRREVKGSGDI